MESLSRSMTRTMSRTLSWWVRLRLSHQLNPDGKLADDQNDELGGKLTGKTETSVKLGL
jgi:hypothetical protein